MDRDVLGLVTDMKLGELRLSAATANGYSQQEVRQESYPVLVKKLNAHTEGVMIEGLTQLAMQRILFFEGDEYVLKNIEILCAGRTRVETNYFSHTGAYEVLEQQWDFKGWQHNEKDALLLHIRNYMNLFGTMTATEADRYWRSEGP